MALVGEDGDVRPELRRELAAAEPGAVGKVEQYADEVRSIKEAIAENTEFMVLLDHPQITREEKVEVMRNISTDCVIIIRINEMPF